jgi:hypothetical protein
MSTQQPPTEEELRAVYEEQIKRIRVEDILMENVVTLINLGMRRTGRMQGTESERDPDQVRLAIESVRAQLPLVEQVAPEQMGPLRQAISQLQLAYVQMGGEPAAAEPAAAEPAAAEDPGTPPAEPASSGPAAGKPGEPGPAQRSGRLWVPGQ